MVLGAVIAAVGLPLALGSDKARAQGFLRPISGAQSGRFIEPPRAIEQQLKDAEQSLLEKRYSDAVVVLGDLLARDAQQMDESDLTGQDFFLGTEDAGAGSVVGTSLLRAARDMIGKLPSAAMETYELRYGAIAKKLLTEASENRDWEKVRLVRRKYFHTAAGYQASWLLAQHEMHLGHPMAASILLEDVVSTKRGIDQLGVGVVVLHASACQLAGRSVSEISAGEAKINGASKTIPTGDEQSAWLAQLSRVLPEFVSKDSDEYPMFGGTPSRNGGSAGQVPLTNLRWMLSTAASPRQERSLREIADELAIGGKLPPPSWSPVRVGSQLLMRTTERLVGVDYRTGKRLWTYPWQSAYETVEEEDIVFDELSGEGNANSLLTQRVWNDVPYGQVTSDGERVFMLDDLGEVEMMSFSPMINLRGTRPADTSTNTLVALEMATEGKLLWRLGAGSEDGSSLSDAFFLGPPLPVDGRLYVMVEIAGDINLCCLDPATGSELWRQHLVAVESGGIDTDPIRRVAGAVPTYHEGVLICPTGAGATVAVDLGDRMLRWGTMYERNAEMIRSINGRGPGVEASRLMQRWDNGTAIADGQAVLVTPVEADRLFGFNLLTGKPLFTEKARVQMRYLAGIRDGRFFVVGGNQVHAFSLEDNGMAVWSAREILSAGQQIAGRGVFGKNTYLVPTTTNQLVELSLKDGSVVTKRNTRYPLGNLVAVDGEVIVQGPTSVSVAFGEATLEPIVNRMLKANPEDFEAIVRKSELLLQRNQRREALEMLGRARQMQPDNDEVQMLSVSAMLGLLRDDADVDSTIIESLEELIDRPAQRVELLSLRIRAAMTSKDYVDAAKRLIDFSRLLIDEPSLESVSDQVINDQARQCTLDSWLAARSHEILVAAAPEQLSQINELMSQAAASRTEATTNSLVRLDHHFRMFEGFSRVKDELLSRHRSAGDHLLFERTILGTHVPTLDEVSTWPRRDSLRLIQSYARAGFGKDVLALIDAVGDEAAAEVDDDYTDSAVVEALPVDLDEVRDLARNSVVKTDWPKKVSMTWDSAQIRTRFDTNNQRVSKTQTLAGLEFIGWQLISDGASPLSLRDPYGMARPLPVEFTRQSDDVDKEAQVTGGAMVVLMPTGLTMIDLYHVKSNDGESVRWQRSLSGDGGPIANRRSDSTPFGGQVIHYNIKSASASSVVPEFALGPVLGDRVLMLQGGDLIALDLMTKESMWRNSTAPKSGVVVSDGHRLAVVSSATSEIMFFDLLDGAKKETKPWIYGDAWESIGANVLSYRKLGDGDGDRYELTLVNALSGKVLLREETPSSNPSADTGVSAQGKIISGRYLAMMRSSGETLIWDLAEGREIGRPKLPAFENLQGLHAMMLEDQMILLPKRRVERPRTQSVEQLQTADGAAHQTTHGVFAVSMTDGALRWGKEFDKPWGCTLTQADATPMLLLTRSPFTYSVPSRKKSLDILALDVRDGEEVAEKLGKPILSGNNELETRLTVQSPLQRVLAQVGPELLLFKYGEVEQGDGADGSAIQPDEVSAEKED
ncbi:outer membrane protein assembly factor BamB family protein [Rubripirellula reticaptiva]|uniref:PQQ enzyme repeat protein n=1 Tax=Rubripirellula reticaptiva TaxID=2528013 RepID=A0A5C6ENS2_9BACT|nr:PQQ-binding-like beta-propeller repeat protein [Rubripirellula reticaptiva]TWU49697.1 PQQ enzyme repeat protein [Rubripirellula reticaptiva]